MHKSIKFRIDGIEPFNLKAGELSVFLNNFEEIISKLVSRKNKDIKKEDVVFAMNSIQDKCVQVEFVCNYFRDANTIWSEIAQSIRDDDYEDHPDIIKNVREILNVTVKRNCRTSLLGDGDEVLVTLDSETEIDDKEKLIHGGTTIYAKVLRVGGKDPRVMVEYRDYTITFGVDLETAKRLGRHVYSEVCMEGTATWDLNIDRIKDFKLDSFEPMVKESFSESFSFLKNKYGSNFEDIEDPVEFIRSMRGSLD